MGKYKKIGGGFMPSMEESIEVFERMAEMANVAAVETSQNINVDSMDCRERGGFGFRGLE